MVVDAVAAIPYLYLFSVDIWFENAAELCLPLFCLFCFMNTCTHHGITLRILAYPALSSLGGMAYAAYLFQKKRHNLPETRLEKPLFA